MARPNVFALAAGTARSLAAAILGTTAAMKLASLLGSQTRAVTQPNFLFPFLSERTVILLALVLEIAAMGSLLGRGSRGLRFAPLALLALALWCYHHLALAFGVPCNCTGLWSLRGFLSDPRLTSALLLALLAAAGVGLALELCARQADQQQDGQ